MSDSEGYRIKQQLGAGLAGPIFLAETASGNVVVRQFKSQAQSGSILRSAERGHFLQAATAMSTLAQPGLVRVVEVIDEGDEAFEVMEYVPYETLKDALDSKVFEVEESNQIIRGLANILHGVHQSGLTHGDLKPSNVFLLPKRELKISDFGISPRARRELGTMPPEWNHAYLAPEHFSNRAALGPRSDQFSLAAIAYHMYTGQLPYRQPGSSSVTDRGQLRSVSQLRPEIPSAVGAVLAKALSVEPQERYASCLQSRTPKSCGRYRRYPRKPCERGAPLACCGRRCTFATRSRGDIPVHET
jgi:serine/threonine-protein kinase